MGVPCGFRVYLLGLPAGALQPKLMRGSGTEELNHVTMVSGQAWVSHTGDAAVQAAFLLLTFLKIA